MPALHRRTGIVSVATLGAITLTVGLAHVTAPGWVRAAGLDVWNTAAERADLNASLARGDQLDFVHERTHQQITLAWGIVSQLEAGRITLVQAVDELDELNADRSSWADGLIFAHHGVPTHRQRVALYAIGKLERQYQDDPSKWLPLSARLEAEYRAMGS